MGDAEGDAAETVAANVGDTDGERETVVDTQSVGVPVIDCDADDDCDVEVHSVSVGDTVSVGERDSDADDVSDTVSDAQAD